MSLQLYTLAIVLMLVVRVPIAFAFIAPSVGYMLFSSHNLPHAAALQQIVGGLNSFVLIAVPMFILMGGLASWVGIAERLFAFILSLVGHLRGSLAYANVAWNVIFSMMSGVAVADAATTSRVVMPIMQREGYPFRFAAGLTVSSSLIGPLIPPSLPAVIFAATASVSLGAMLLAGVLPGLVIVAVLLVHIWLWARRHPELVRRRATFGEVVHAGVGAIPALLTPVILVVGILGGVVTPTEASALAVVYLLLLAVPYRLLRRGTRFRELAQLGRLLREAGETTGMVLLIVAASQLCAYILALEGAPRMIAEMFLDLTENKYVFLLLLNVVLLILGILFEVSAMLVVTVALILPVATSYGVDPLHLGVILIVNLLLGSVSPPVGLLLSVVSAATGRSLNEVNKGVIPFFGPLVGALLVITFVPALSLWLPHLAGFTR